MCDMVIDAGWIHSIDESRQEYSEIRNIKPQKLGQLKGTENEAREIEV